MQVLCSGNKTEVVKLIAKFCNDIPVTRVRPSSCELDGLWMKCSLFEPTAVSAAICALLPDLLASHDWQPPLRAIHVLLHFYSKGEQGKLVVTEVMTKAGDFVRHLADEVPECMDGASKIVLISRLAAIVPGDEVWMANEGGLISFTTSNDTPDSLAKEKRVGKLVNYTASKDTPDSLRKERCVSKKSMSADLIKSASSSVSSSAPPALAPPPAPTTSLACAQMPAQPDTLAWPSSFNGHAQNFASNSREGGRVKRVQPPVPVPIPRGSLADALPTPAEALTGQSSSSNRVASPSREADKRRSEDHIIPANSAPEDQVLPDIIGEVLQRSSYIGEISKGTEFFCMADGESDTDGESPELNEMFNACQKRVACIPSGADILMEKSMQRPREPFAFVAEHFDKMRR